MDGRADDALVFLDQALGLDPENAFALGTKGQICVAQGRFDEAEDLLLRARGLTRDVGLHRAR